MKRNIKNLLGVLFATVTLQACTGFHIRESISLPKQYQQIHIAGLSPEAEFSKSLEYAIEEAGGQLISSASSRLIISDLKEGKRAVAYTNERKAREYLLFLKFNYRLSSVNTNKKSVASTSLERINLDKTYLYDANFALGKAEEEKQIRDKLYAEAARLILLRIKHQ